MQDVKLSIRLKVKDMFIFQMRHAYHGIQGIIGVLISLGAFGYFLATKSQNDDAFNLILIFTALLFTIIIPFNQLSRSFKIIALNPVYQKPLDYVFCDEGIKVSQEKDEALLPWDAVMSVKESFDTLYIYSSPKNGYILPIIQFKDEYTKIIECIKEKTIDTCEVEIKNK